VAPSISKLIEDAPAVASLPSVYHRLTEVMNDPYSSAADFGKIVAEDSGLTIRLLRLVNSAFYSMPSRVESVTQALAVVGLEQLHDLVLATSVLTMFRDVPPELVDMESFWRHSLATGVACRVMAGQRRMANVERLFVGGLLHDVGRLLIYIGNPDGARTALERCNETNELLYDVERETMGYDHATVGRLLLSAWNLPGSLQEPIGYHHDPKKAKRFPIEAAMIHVADITAHALQMGTSGERFVPPLSGAALYRLDGDNLLTPSTIAQIDLQYHAAIQAVLQFVA
jgi:HD-like signal output (HDOD) protein